MVSIETKFIGPSNTRGSRIAASTCNGQRIVVSCDDALNHDENHMATAMILRDRMHWKGELVQGATKAGYVHVFVDGPTSAQLAAKLPRR